jgi:hypothetical protein
MSLPMATYQQPTATPAAKIILRDDEIKRRRVRMFSLAFVSVLCLERSHHCGVASVGRGNSRPNDPTAFAKCGCETNDPTAFAKCGCETIAMLALIAKRVVFVSPTCGRHKKLDARLSCVRQ